jgi:hypothetical protein
MEIRMPRSPFAGLHRRSAKRPTRFERVTLVFGAQTPTPPIPEQGIYSIARMGCCKPPGNHATARFLTPCYVALRDRAMALS